MLEITRQNLTLTISNGAIPSQGSSHVPVKFNNDQETYQDYLILPTIGWYSKVGCYQSLPIEYDMTTSTMYLPAEAFLNNGIIAIAVGLLDPANSAHKEVTAPITARVTNAPLGDIELPKTEIWEAAVANLVKQLIDTVVESVNEALSKADQCIENDKEQQEQIKNIKREISSLDQTYAKKLDVYTQTQTNTMLNEKQNKVLFGTTPPADTIGEDGDIYIQIESD